KPAPEPVNPSPPVPAAAPGQTRLMVVSVQKENRKLMIGAGAAMGALLIFGAVTVLYFSWRTAGLDEKVAKGVDKNAGQQISDKLRKSTVWIRTLPNANGGYFMGSGMLVNAEEKIVVTNYHVVARSRLSPLMEIPGVLTNADFDSKAKLYVKVHPLRLPAKVIQIDVQSGGFDCQVGVEDANGKPLALSGGGTLGRKRIQFSTDHDGDYRAIVIGRGIGNYKLAVSLIIPDVHPLLEVNFPEYADGKAIIEKDYYLNLVKSDAEKYKAKVIAFSDAKDLAVLKLNYVPNSVGAVPLAKESARSGQEVHSIGNPGASKFLWIYTSGPVRTADVHRAKYLVDDFCVDAWVIETQSPI